MSRVALKAFLLVVPSYGEFPGSIRSQLSGKCWDLPGGDFTRGNVVWQWTCSGTDNQRWTLREDDHTLRPSASPDKCVDVGTGTVWGSDFANGDQIQIWDCLGVPQQGVGWDSNMGTIYFSNTGSDASKCVDLAGGGFEDGTPMIVWDCIGNANQQWLYTPDSGGPTPAPQPTPQSAVSLIKARETHQCVEVQGGKQGSQTNGAQLQLWDCNHRSHQKWMFSDGEIMLGDKSKCVDAPDTGNGSPIQIWDCNGLPQQLWGYDSVRQSIYMTQSLEDSSKCLQIVDSSGIPGTPLEIWNCLPYGNQKWELEDASTSIVVA